VLNIIENDPGIIHVGFQKDVRPFLAASNALAFPSYREGFPNVPMQAGCFELPAIVSDINGCNEIIEHGKNGLIVPAKDVDGLYNAMEKLATDKELFATLKRNARPMIVERFEQKHFWSLLLQEYRQHLTNIQNKKRN
jgi:glycosyltransferase involved in cell wall biosynthesis